MEGRECLKTLTYAAIAGMSYLKKMSLSRVMTHNLPYATFTVQDAEK